MAETVPMPASSQGRRRRLPIPEAIEALEAVYGQARAIPRFDALEELVCCILSQHSADANSFPTFTRLRAAAPDWAAIAAMPTTELADMIRGAGLANQKAKTIQSALRAAAEAFGEITLEPLRALPTEEAMAWLQALPGVGPKTASIVMGFSFGRDVIPVDTHVSRVGRRLAWIPTRMTDVAAHDHLRRTVPAGWAFRFHNALIQHGRQTCRAPRPDCASCVLAGDCPKCGVTPPRRQRAVRS